MKYTKRQSKSHYIYIIKTFLRIKIIAMKLCKSGIFFIKFHPYGTENWNQLSPSCKWIHMYLIKDNTKHSSDLLYQSYLNITEGMWVLNDN